jgi:hypothetical protein
MVEQCVYMKKKIWKLKRQVSSLIYIPFAFRSLEALKSSRRLHCHHTDTKSVKWPEFFLCSFEELEAVKSSLLLHGQDIDMKSVKWSEFSFAPFRNLKP